MNILKAIIKKEIQALGLGLVLAFGLVACGSGDGGDNYSDATLSGAWFMDGSSLGKGDFYFVSDGGGIITASSISPFPADTGIYSVSSDGSFLFTIVPGTAEETTFSGTLSSATAGTVTSVVGGGVAPGAYNLPISKVPDVSALNGTFAGTLTETCTDTINYPELCNGTVYNASALVV